MSNDSYYQNANDNHLNKEDPPVRVEIPSATHTEHRPLPQRESASPNPIQPSPRAPEVPPDFVQVELPSNFVPYAFKTLHLGRIKGIHQAKLARANKEQSSRIVVECISSLLKGASAFDLTPSDFRWLLYKLLKENYVKSPRMVTAYCSDPNHVEKVATGEMPPQTLQNIGSLNHSLLNETAYDPTKVQQLIDSNEHLRNMKLGYATMKETLEAVEKDDDEFSWLAELAMCLSPYQEDGKPPLTLEQRVELVGNKEPEELEALAQYAEATSNYGVEEIIRMRCTGCGAEILEPFQPSAHMFL